MGEMYRLQVLILDRFDFEINNIFYNESYQRYIQMVYYHFLVLCQNMNGAKRRNT
jgi:hypothetical protein